MSKELTVRDLKVAEYNPRVISKKDLDNLHKSMRTYGDLSGIVFNIRTKTLISGHQRLSPYRDGSCPTKIIKKPVKDKFGTVAEGQVAIKTPEGILRIPYREVDWSDRKAEKAANIAANAHGGDFDSGKLSVLLAEISKDKKFDVDLLGLDPLTVRTLMPKMPTLGADGSSDDDDDDSSEGGFKEYDGDSFEFEHKCPKCKYRW